MKTDPAPTRYYQAAVKAARWIDSRARETAHGLAWNEPGPPVRLPADFPPDLLYVDQGPYYGNAGVIRFWLELHRHSRDAGHLERAVRGGDHVLAHLPAAAPENPAYAGQYGSHDGWGGVLWVLEQVHLASGEQRFREGALRLLEQIHADARDDGYGVHWDETNELFYGNAGHGLLLLWAAEAFGHAPSRRLAARAGRWLLTSSRPRAGGVAWPWGSHQSKVLMPNFSHGTAGVAYFLARLGQITGEEVFLGAAGKGAGHLVAIAETGGGRHCLVPYQESATEEITGESPGEPCYYLGFCHGPAGTSRTFEQLFQATGEARWRQWAERGTRAILESGIPERRPPGFWNNVSQCCGSAGVIDHFLAQYRLAGDPAHLDFARRLADDLIGRASEQDGGLKWIQAERRVKPELLEAQVGYMQGAAGVAAALLHLDAALRGRDIPHLRFIDDPWPSTGPDPSP